MSKEKQEFLFGLEPENKISQTSAVLLIETKNGTTSFLAAKRLNRRGFTIPGGKLEKGESVKKCAIREVTEETGIKIFSSEYLISAHPEQKGISICDNNNNYLTHIFFCFYDESTNRSTPINKEPEKQSDWQWIPLSKLPTMIIEGNLHPALNQEFMYTTIKECLSSDDNS